MILAADVGGTSARMALFDVLEGRLHSVVERTYPSAQFSGFGDVIEQFIALAPTPIATACFGIAGPVRRGKVVTPNLPWVVDAALLAQRFHLKSVTLLNDLESNAWGIEALGPEEILTLNAGDAEARGNAGLIAAGSGLGEAGLFFDGERLRPFACEGGHTDYAARNSLEFELLQYLTRKFGRVSYERVLSGPGLKNIYDFLRSSGRGEESPAVAAAMNDADPSAMISEAALNGTCALCVSALDLFASIYGAEAGNLALKFLAVSGLYLGGGIAPKIAEKLRDGGFMRAFLDKGRMRPLLEAMPVRLILNPKTALLGAAQYAARATGAIK